MMSDCGAPSNCTAGSIGESAEGGASLQTTVIEVYEYPSDCLATELLYHFSRPPYLAQCITPLHTMWNYRSSSFVMEFPTSEALHIVQDPVQQLDEGDRNSQIRLSLLGVRRCSQVLVTCQHELSHRMIRHFFGKFGVLESCQQSSGTEDYAVILTYKDRSDAEKVCQEKSYNMGPGLSVRTQLFADALAKGEPSSPTGTAYTLNFDIDSISCADFEMNSYVDKMSNVGVSQEVGRFSPLYFDASTDQSYLTFESLSTEPQHVPVGSSKQPAKELSSDTGVLSHHYETIDLKSTNESSLKPLTTCESSTSSAAPDDSKTSVAPDAVNTSVASGSEPKLSAPTIPSVSLPTLIYSVPTVRLHSCIQVNNCIVRLLYGDISQHIADVLVHSGGQAQQALARKWYVSPEPIKTVEVLRAPNHGIIEVATAPNLPASYVFGMRFSNRPTGLIKSKQQLVNLCLLHCSVLKARSIAFPAVGTGMIGQRASVMATALISCMVDHMNHNTKSTLELIDIVIYENSILNDYASALKDAASSSRSTNFKNLLSKRKSKVENVYQVSNTSHKIQVD